MTPLILSALLLAPSADPKPVPATRTEEKAALEAYKQARPRLPMPPRVEGARGVNNGRFRAYYLPEFRTTSRSSRQPDPAMTLDRTFKVKLFWITSRTNNCYY